MHLFFYRQVLAVFLPLAPGSSTLAPSLGRVAQLVEQRTENPRVGSSILPPATILSLFIIHIIGEIVRPDSIELPRRLLA